MAGRSERLKRLVKLQEQIKALHETRHAMHLSQARQAGDEASALVDSLNAASPLPGLFPDLYARRITSAIDRQQRQSGLASAEAGLVANANARTQMVERAYREALRFEDRREEERQQLENVERGLGGQETK